MPRPPSILVVAAVIEKDDQVLIGQRHRDDSHPLKWEFPGGKVEHGESPRQALRRELQEELGINAVIGDELARYEFQYPRRSPVTLIFHHVSDWTGEIRNIVFESLAWDRYAHLPNYDFLDGDIAFVRELARRRGRRNAL